MSLVNKSALIEIIRPKQWYKNLLVFVPLMTSLHLFDPNLLFLSLLGFIALCMSSSGTYIINDLIDSKKDLHHPQKSARPIPAGRISRKVAISYSIILLCGSEILSYLLGMPFFIVNTTFISLTIFYSVRAKNIFMLDIFLIAINYVLRAMQIPKGSHKIDFKFEPKVIKTGSMIALGSSILFLALIFGGLFYLRRKVSLEENDSIDK